MMVLVSVACLPAATTTSMKLYMLARGYVDEASSTFVLYY
jgi:hypothetical protein